MEHRGGEKRPAPTDHQTVLLDGVHALLVEVEGTIIPSSFIKDVLIPCAKSNLKTFLEGSFGDEELQKEIDHLRTQVLAEKDTAGSEAALTPASDASKEDVIDGVVSIVLGRIETDAQSAAVRPLLERTWREALKTDCICADVYEDVVPVLRQILSDGVRVYSYSARAYSKDFQNILFCHSNKGDIRESFTQQFDSSVGKPGDKDTYTEIVKQIDLNAGEILYVTHCPLQAAAACEANLKTCVIVREGHDEALADDVLHSNNVICSFDELLDDSIDEVPAKRAHGGEDDNYYDYGSTDGGATNDSEYSTGVHGGHGLDGDGDEEEHGETGRGDAAATGNGE